MNRNPQRRFLPRIQPPRFLRPRPRTVIIRKTKTVKAKPKQSLLEKSENSLKLWFARTIKLLNFPTMVYVSVIIGLYLNHIGDPNDSILNYILTYLNKIPILGDVIDYYITQPSKLIGTLLFVTVPMNINDRKYRGYIWFAALTTIAIIMPSQPILLYIMQTISVLTYLKTNSTNFVNTLLCLLPLIYYLLTVHSPHETVNGTGFNSTGNLSIGDSFDNYTMPPIKLVHDKVMPALSRGKYRAPTG